MTAKIECQNSHKQIIYHVKRYNTKGKGFKGSTIFAKEKRHSHLNLTKKIKKTTFLKKEAKAQYTCPCKYENFQSEFSKMVEKCEIGLCCRTQFSLTSQEEPQCCEGLSAESDRSVPLDKQICLSPAMKNCQKNNKCDEGECGKYFGKDPDGVCRVLPRNADSCLKKKCFNQIECSKDKNGGICMALRINLVDLNGYCDNNFFRCKAPFICYNSKCKNPPKKESLEACEKSSDCEDGLQCYKIFADPNQIQYFNSLKYKGMSAQQIEKFKTDQLNSKMREQDEEKRSLFGNPFSNILGSIKGSANNAINSIKDFGKDVINEAKDIGNKVIDKGEELGKGLAENAKELKKKGEEKAKSLAKKLKGGLDSLLDDKKDEENKDSKLFKSQTKDTTSFNSDTLEEKEKISIIPTAPVEIKANLDGEQKFGFNNQTVAMLKDDIVKANTQAKELNSFGTEDNIESKNLKVEKKAKAKYNRFKGITTAFHHIKNHQKTSLSSHNQKIQTLFSSTSIVFSYKLCMRSQSLNEGEECFFTPECKDEMQCETSLTLPKCRKGLAVDKPDGPYERRFVLLK